MHRPFTDTVGKKPERVYVRDKRNFTEVDNAQPWFIRVQLGFFKEIRCNRCGDWYCALFDGCPTCDYHPDSRSTYYLWGYNN